jgi:hypothetical protein
VQNRIEEVTGAIAGEDATGAVAAVGSGSEAECQDTGLGIAEAGDRACPVDLVDIGTALALADTLAVFAKSRAAFTCGNSFMERCEGRRSRWGGFPGPYRIWFPSKQ